MAGIDALEFIDTGIHDTDVKSALLDTKFPYITTIAKTGRSNFACDAKDGDGIGIYAADDACIQAALNSVPSDSIIYVMPGAYTLNSQITQYAKNITIIGIGDVKWFLAAGVPAPNILFSGTVITSSLLSVDSLTGSMSVTLATNSNLVQTGDIISIVNSDLWCPHDYPTQVTGESYTVTRVSGNVIYLNQPLIRDYTTAKASAVNIYRPIKVNIQNIKIINSSNLDLVQSMKLLYCKDSKISDCEFSNSGLVGLWLYTCYNVEVCSNYMHDCEGAGYGYGAEITNASACIRIHDNLIERCRHCISVGTSDHALGLNRDIKILENTFVGGVAEGSNLIDAHTPTIDYQVLNNHFYIQLLNSYACINGSESLVFSNNHIYGGGAVKRRGKHNGGNYIIENNIIAGNGYGALYFDSSCEAKKGSLKILNNVVNGGCVNSVYISSEIFNTIDIFGNTIDGSSDNTISISVPKPDANNDLGEIYADMPTAINISKNTILNSQKSAIWIERKAITYPTELKILDNTIRNANKSNMEYDFIATKDISNSQISGNSILMNSSADCCINELDTLGGADNNVIAGNTLHYSNCVVPSYYAPTVLDSFDATTGWNITNGSGTITTENGRLKVTGTTDASGNLLIAKTFSSFGANHNYISFLINASMSVKMRFSLKTDDSNYISWVNDSRFKLSANTDITYSLPTRTAMGTTGMLPNNENGVAYNPNNITKVFVGIYDLSIPSTDITFYLDTLYIYLKKFIRTVGVHTRVDKNIGHRTENYGSATVLAGTTSISVTHYLAGTPNNINITAASSTSGISYNVSGKTDQTFTITMDSAPTSDVTFDWVAKI